MKQEITTCDTTDCNGNPAGGMYNAEGLNLMWQCGPLGRGDGRREPNGTFVESVIEAARLRLEYYQDSRFACVENARAIRCMEEALLHLESRTQAREAREVEGTHKV